MKNRDLAIAALKKNAIVCAGLYLYHYDDAISLVNICKKYNIKILGIDAFFVSDGYTHPVMEHSIDFTSISNGKSDVDAYSFLESKKHKDLVYEIIYDDDDD